MDLLPRSRRRAASGSYQRVYDARGRKPGGGILEVAGEMEPSFRLRESCSRTSLEMATVCEIDVRRPSGKHASTPFIRSRGRLRHFIPQRRRLRVSTPCRSEEHTSELQSLRHL